MKNIINIIIPARNEEGVIIQTLDDLAKKIKYPYRVIVVNDKSTDTTEDVVKKYIKKHKKVTLVNNKSKQSGFGQALKTGFKTVKSGPVVFVMADLCDDPKTINKMFEKINDGFDVVCGSRYMDGGEKKGGPRFQGFCSHIVNQTLRNLVRIPTADASNAFKMYKHEILANIIFNTTSGVEVSMEILGQTYFNGAKIYDIPTVWTGREIGKSKFKLIQRTPRYTRIYLWILKNQLRKLIAMDLVKFYTY